MKTRSIKYLTTSIFWYLVKMWSVLFLATFSYLELVKTWSLLFLPRFLFLASGENVICLYFWQHLATWDPISAFLQQISSKFLYTTANNGERKLLQLHKTCSKQSTKNLKNEQLIMRAFTVLQQYPVLFFVRRSLASLSTGVPILETHFFCSSHHIFHRIINNWL